MEYQFLNTMLDTFKNASISGMVALKNPALGIATVLGILDVTAMWGMYFGDMRVREIIGKAVKIGFFVFLIMHWGPLTVTVEDTFIKVGQIASHSEAGTRPSSIMVQGQKKMYRLWNNAINDIPMADGKTSYSSHTPFYDENGDLQKNYKDLLKEKEESSSGITNPFAGIGESIAAIPGRLIKIVLCLAIFVAFAFIALNVLLCFIEFYLTTTLSIILLPFGVNSHTSFISQKAIGAVVNFGVKLMVMIFLLGLMSTMIAKMDVITNDDYGTLFETVLQACMYAFLIWKLPGLISGMLNGMPQMGASMGGVINGTRNVMNGASKAGSAAVSAGRAMFNASRVAGDSFRAGRAMGRGHGWRTPMYAAAGAASHVGGVMKDLAAHRINRAKSLILNHPHVASNKARMLSESRARDGGYGK